MGPKAVEPIELDDPCSVAARVFREGRIVSYDPTDPTAPNPGCPVGRQYKGKAFLSVPVLYGAPGQTSRPIGVINLTDRVGEDAFTAGDRKLVAAIANQIGAAIENARLVARDLGQERMRQELELAHDLQLKLLPSPLGVAAPPRAAAACRPPLGVAAGVGCDEARPWRRRHDLLCLFTDGLADATNDGGARFGEQRVLGHVTALRQRPAREILEAIYTDVAAFTGGGPASDDRTLVLLKV